MEDKSVSAWLFPPATRRLCAVAVLGACFAVTGAAGATPTDDRPAIFWAQAQRITNLGEVAEGLARCGIRSPEWSEKLQLRIDEAVIRLSDRLWPDSWKDVSDNGPSAARGAAIAMAYDIQKEASERGRHATPRWCADTGPGAATLLDEFVGGNPLR